MERLIKPFGNMALDFAQVREQGAAGTCGTLGRMTLNG
jgi:hypothetical protein